MSKKLINLSWPEWRRNTLGYPVILLVAVFIASTANQTFFSKVLGLYGWGPQQAGFYVSLFVLLVCLNGLVISVLSMVLPARWVMSFLLLLAAGSAYFTDSFGTVIDLTMVQNSLETDTAEAIELLSAPFSLHLFVYALLPIGLLWWLPQKQFSYARIMQNNGTLTLCLVLLSTVCLVSSGNRYADLFREHKTTRYYSNPLYPLNSIVSYANERLSTMPSELISPVMAAARVPEQQVSRELVIMVVGETARRDRFSLNGYERPTNPRLAEIDNLVSYTQITACGTTTAVSVPCMFTVGGSAVHSSNSIRTEENILDVLQRAGVSVLWRDNNSDSKGVAERVTFQDFRSSTLNPVCDVECRDVGMLNGLQEYIDSQTADIFIVLHQKGNHGPAYYLRYPESFEHFSPTCESKELFSCSDEEINNTYDNAIRYTDHFLAEVIALLQHNTPGFETAMLYVSDHGESLGEKGVYLHGMPNILAPAEQLEVPVILWAGESSDIDISSARRLRDTSNTHDAVYKSLLTLFEIPVEPEYAVNALFTMKPEEELVSVEAELVPAG